MGGFTGKVVIVTAAAGAGIGQETVRSFAREGADVVVADAHPKRPFDVADDIAKKYNVKAVGVHCDVTKEEDIQTMVNKAISELGKIDVLINDAAIDRLGRGWEIDDTDWNDVLNVTLTGTFRGIRAVFPHMVKQKSGKIVNISSTAAWEAGGTDSPMYIAAKAAVLGLTRAYARIGAPYNINVNAIAPGLIPNPFLIKVAPKELMDGVRKQQLLDCDGKTTDIANAALFLSSDKNSFITGETISVNGGIYLRP